jgi:hypothetical protein
MGLGKNPFDIEIDRQLRPLEPLCEFRRTLHHKRRAIAPDVPDIQIGAAVKKLALFSGPSGLFGSKSPKILPSLLKYDLTVRCVDIDQRATGIPNYMAHAKPSGETDVDTFSWA